MNYPLYAQFNMYADHCRKFKYFCLVIKEGKVAQGSANGQMERQTDTRMDGQRAPYHKRSRISVHVYVKGIIQKYEFYYISTHYLTVDT